MTYSLLTTATPSSPPTMLSTSPIHSKTGQSRFSATSQPRWPLQSSSRCLRSVICHRRTWSSFPMTSSALAVSTRSFCGPIPRREGIPPAGRELNDKGLPRDSTWSSLPAASAGSLRQVGGVQSTINIKFVTGIIIILNCTCMS